MKNPGPKRSGVGHARLIEGSDGLRQSRVQFDAVRMGALFLFFAVTFAEESVEFVDEEIDGLIGIVAVNGGNEVGAKNLDLTLGDKVVLGRLGFVQFDVDTDAIDARFVAQEATGFFLDGRFHCIAKVEVNTAKDELRADIFRGYGIHTVIIEPPERVLLPLNAD